MQNVCVVLLNWNGKEDTSACLQSLKGLEGLDVIVVDNGSTDDSVVHFKKAFPWVQVIETGENLGYAGGNNVGAYAALDAGAEFVCLLNNDTVVEPGFASAFLQTFKKRPGAGVLGAKIYLMDEPDRFDHFGGKWNRRKCDFDYVGWREVDDGETFEEPFPLDYVCGACIVVRKEVFERIGMLDERFFLYFEETDFCFRARKAGFEVLACPSAKIWHKVSASFTGGKPHSSYFFWRNRLLWLERNFSGLERMFYFGKTLGLALPAVWQLKLLRSMQLGLKRLARPKADCARSRARLLQNDARISGMHDYLFRRFGKGRSDRFIGKPK